MIPWIVIDNNESDFSFIEQIEVSGCILSVFSKDDLCVGVVDDVLTGLVGVGGVDADRNAASHHRAIETEKPLRGIKSNHVYYVVFRHLAGN